MVRRRAECAREGAVPPDDDDDAPVPVESVAARYVERFRTAPPRPPRDASRPAPLYA